MSQSKIITPVLFIGLIIALLGMPVQSNSEAVNLYVSQTGNDSWGGAFARAERI